jgi:putative ABC transport system permease protein
MRIGEEAHIEHEIGERRRAARKAKAADGNRGALRREPAKLLANRLLKIVCGEIGGGNDNIGPATQRLQQFALGGAVRAAVAAVDSNLPLDAVRPLRSLVDDSLADRRLQATLLGAFSLLALVLAATGIYGVMAYSVSRRVQEIGIRIALGARLDDILMLVLRQGMGLTLAGLLIGLAGGLAVARLLSGLLFEIAPNDPPTFGAVVVLLALVALLACWWPARRAARVDPMEALRSE